MSETAFELENWRIPIFERHLNKAVYSSTRTDGATEGTMVFTVTADNYEALHEVLSAANAEVELAGEPQ